MRSVVHQRRTIFFHISQESIIAFFWLFPYIKVFGISQLFSDRIYSLSIVIDFLVVTLYHLVKIRKYDKTVLIWLLYSLLMIVTCFVNSKSVLYAGYYAGKIVGFYLLNQHYLWRGKLTLLKTTRAYLTFLIVVTCVLQFVKQDLFGYTASRNYQTFFVSDNFLGYFYASYIALCVILDSIEKSRICTKTYSVILICLCSIIRAWSVKAVLGILVIGVYVFFVYGRTLSKILSGKKLLMLYIVILLGILLFNVQDYFSRWLYDLLGRGASLSGRTYIWNAVFQNIRNSPLIGHGLNSNGLWAENITFQGKVFSSHNMVLEVLIQVGVLGLILYVLFVISAAKKGANVSKYIWQDEYLFLVFIVFVIFVMGIASATLYEPFYYLPIILLANMESLVAIKRKRFTSD